MNWKLLRKIVGAILLVIGVLALVTPLTPGAWLIFVGGAMLEISALSPENVKRQSQRLKDWWAGKKEEKIGP